MNSVPKAIGPYSPIVIAGNIAFCSGQVGASPQTGELARGIEDQTKQTLENLRSVLNSEGFQLSDVVKTTVFLKNIEDFAKMNEIYSLYFNESKPARSTIGVANLPKGALIEIEAIAIK
ncbi:MAG: hypothetical protein A3F31_02195 [Candidatus Levybacteria bacterium RIFCSPHIGHO2_12_FULL_38_12]|nr:MAG: hypothetical protein A2770_03115 [Candidatus Levybacteria bacterium RIFCSPHIGHO2_01_FULL_38_12]OGH22795.1 MAG: hypothetical protein A3F31_02195 [Candidatus Levybacteria bacterium RIFCSPHIGHO2_12_FULL_38_12]OGH33984.1 MAG: hypothetical protein A3A47_00310 [Candidatus Levybacteria bacterium RIFCSPLOWO2_01_FULL_37_20]OGH44804.1 MAG: hypothetical protein A3J14_04650 [Candidatus Levybacteria bacterium RIFCSPLOWO2_02_FULL_37_18]OGH51036.1 MAG: hypothetical protein A3G13_03095 [Candidatus Levy